MPSRSTRWSLSKPSLSAPRSEFLQCSVGLSVLSLVVLSSASFALDDTPNIDLLDDPLATEFAREFDQRLLVREAPYAQDERDFITVSPYGEALPVPVVVPPSDDLVDNTVILPAEKPAQVADHAPEWILYQTTVAKGAPEEALFNRINEEYGSEPQRAAMELLEWPEESLPDQPSFEIFETELISPFSPIPELDELPFPDA